MRERPPKLYFAEFRRTAGNIVCDTAGAWAALTSEVGGAGAGDFDLAVNAQAGDVLLVGCNALWSGATSPTTAVVGRLDLATIVSGSPVNYVGQRAGTASGGSSIPGFSASTLQLAAATVESDRLNLPSSIAGPLPYPVQAGDISAGVVTLRPYVKVDAGGRDLFATSDNPLVMWVLNIRQVAAS